MTGAPAGGGVVPPVPPPGGGKVRPEGAVPPGSTVRPAGSSRPALTGALGLVLVLLVAVLAAALEILLIPLRVGTVLLPATVVFAIAGNVALPRLARSLLPSAAAAAMPFVAWLVAVVWLALSPRPEGDVLVRAGGGEQWVFYSMLLGGVTAAVATLMFAVPRPRPQPSSPR